MSGALLTISLYDEMSAARLDAFVLTLSTPDMASAGRSCSAGLAEQHTGVSS